MWAIFGYFLLPLFG